MSFLTCALLPLVPLLPQTQVEDPRIDLCIFCLPPHRLRNIDVIYMHTISQVVPVVPVVTKSDTMTIREAAMHRANVASRIAHPGIPGLKGAPLPSPR